MRQAPPLPDEVRDDAPREADTEVSVLGAMLIDHDARTEALGRLEPEDFYLEANRTVFTAFRRLHDRGQAADVALLADELKSSEELEAVGGMPYLAQLVDAVPNGRRIREHASRLRELRALRELRDLATDTLEVADSAGPGEAGGMVSAVTERLRDIEARASVADEDGLRTAREILEDPEARKQPASVLDRLAFEGRLTLFAAREKCGKSTTTRFSVSRLTCGRHVWTGEPLPAGPRSVLYWAEEVPGDVARDLERMGADLDRVHVRDMRLIVGDRFAALQRDLDRVQPALLVIDTLPTFTDNMELESGASDDWQPVMNRFGALAQEYSVAVLLNHHATKHDGGYRDSTAIGAGVDLILEMRRDPQEGKNVRTVEAKPRSAVDVNDFKYELVEDGEGPRLELLDGSLSLDERIVRFVRVHQPCSQRQIREGVRGQVKTIRRRLDELTEEGGPLHCNDETTPFQYTIRQEAGGTASEPVQNRERTGVEGNGGRSGSRDPHRDEVSGGREPQAEPSGGDET